MANYQLGPVIGKIGGGVEIITEQVSVGGSSSRSWELPDGWEAGYIALRGHGEHSGYGSAQRNTIFGESSMPVSTNSSGAVHGFGELPATLSTGSGLSVNGTVTLIRTA